MRCYCGWLVSGTGVLPTSSMHERRKAPKMPSLISGPGRHPAFDRHEENLNVDVGSSMFHPGLFASWECQERKGQAGPWVAAPCVIALHSLHPMALSYDKKATVPDLGKLPPSPASDFRYLNPNKSSPISSPSWVSFTGRMLRKVGQVIRRKERVNRISQPSRIVSLSLRFSSLLSLCLLSNSTPTHTIHRRAW